MDLVENIDALTFINSLKLKETTNKITNMCPHEIKKQTMLVNELERNNEELNMKILKHSSDIMKATVKNKKIVIQSQQLQEQFNKISLLIANANENQLSKVTEFHRYTYNSISESKKNYVIKNILMSTLKTQLSNSNSLKGIVVKNNNLQHFEFQNTTSEFEIIDKMWNFI